MQTYVKKWEAGVKVPKNAFVVPTMSASIQKVGLNHLLPSNQFCTLYGSTIFGDVVLYAGKESMPYLHFLH